MILTILVQVTDHGILKIVFRILETANRRLHQDLIIEVCHLLEVGISKFDGVFEVYCSRICIKLLGHISGKLSSQKLVLSCVRVITRVFASNRASDVSSHWNKLLIGQRITLRIGTRFDDRFNLYSRIISQLKHFVF